MIVTHLNLTDFRNYETLDVAIVPGTNVFVGSNGQGKTNLVEALGYLSTLGSHRVATDQALIRFGADAAIVRARLHHGDRHVLAELQINRTGTNRAQINRSAIKTRELTRYFASVVFAPEDLALVRGDPSVRRRFMDELLVQRYPRLISVLSDYDRVLRQRNTLLKSLRVGSSRDESARTLDIWDERLIGFGSEIIAAREGLVVDLLPEVARAYQTIAGADHSIKVSQLLSIGAENNAQATEVPADGVAGPSDVSEIAEIFRASLIRVRNSERDRGISLVGPHRDDLVLELNGMPARSYASHGESWSLALSLKLGSAGILRRDSPSGDPVLILDDVFAELDETRRARLGKAIRDFEQVLITAAVLDDVPAELSGHVIRIRAGAVVQESE